MKSKDMNVCAVIVSKGWLIKSVIFSNSYLFILPILPKVDLKTNINNVN